MLLGGAPPRMLRLAPAGRALLAGGGFTVTDATSAALARRLLDGGVAHPVPDARRRARAGGRHRRDPGQGPRPTPSPACSPRSRRDLGRRDRRRRRVGRSRPRCGARRRGARRAAVLRHATPRGPAAARNAGLAAATHPAGRLPRLRRRARARAGSQPLLAHLADPAVGLVAPRIVALPAGHAAGWAATRPCGRRSTSARTRPLVVPRSRVAYVPSAALLVRRAAVGAGFDERHARRRGRRPRAAPARRGLAAALRARRPRRARPPHRAARVVAAQGVLRHRRGPARAAPPGRGAADGAQPVGGGVTSALLLARRPRRGRGGGRRRRVPPGPRKLGRLRAPALDRGPADRARRRRAPPRRPPTPSPATTGRSPRWPRSVSRRARRTVAAVALGEGVVDWLRHRDRDPDAARPARVPASPTGSTTSPTAPACGGVPLRTARSPRCARSARGRDGRADDPNPPRVLRPIG